VTLDRELLFPRQLSQRNKLYLGLHPSRVRMSCFSICITRERGRLVFEVVGVRLKAEAILLDLCKRSTLGDYSCDVYIAFAFVITVRFLSVLYFYSLGIIQR
jgi:hypothetical protein